MKNFFIKYKTKILLTLFFAFLLLLLNNNVFASFDFEYAGEQKSLTDLPFNTDEHPDFVISFNTGDNYYQVGYPQTTPVGRFFADQSSNYGGDFGYKILYTIGDTNELGHWVYYNYDSTTNTWSSKKVTSGYSLIWSRPEYSTLDIYNAIDSDEIFFQVAPPEEIPEEETPKAGTLQEIMEQLEKETVLKEIVALLPVILSVLVSLIALRKALKMLLNFLRTS